MRFMITTTGEPTTLLPLLTEQHITHLAVLGIATDYCVKFTVLDALAAGFAVTVITDGCRGLIYRQKTVSGH